MAQSRPILYSYFRSSCSWRVRTALLYKGIDFEYKIINLLKDEQSSEEFKKLSPLGTIPILVHNGKVISTSTAILEYLEEVFPSPALLPKDPFARAQVRAVSDGIISGIQPLQNMRVLMYVGDKSDVWARHWVESGFDAIEKMLETTHGTFCVGDELSLADLCLVPQEFNARTRFKVDMDKYPLIKEITARLYNMKIFKDSHPISMPDCPENLRSQS